MCKLQLVIGKDIYIILAIYISNPLNPCYLDTVAYKTTICKRVFPLLTFTKQDLILMNHFTIRGDNLEGERQLWQLWRGRKVISNGSSLGEVGAGDEK